MSLLHEVHANLIGILAVFELVVSLGLVADGYFMKQSFGGVSWLYVPYWSVALILVPFMIGIFTCITGRRLLAFVFSVCDLVCFLVGVAYLVILWSGMGGFQSMEVQLNKCLSTDTKTENCVCRDGLQAGAYQGVSCIDVDTFITTVHIALALEIINILLTLTGTLVSAAFGAEYCSNQEACLFCLSRQEVYDLDKDREENCSFDSVTDVSVIGMDRDDAYEMVEVKGTMAARSTQEPMFY